MVNFSTDGLGSILQGVEGFIPETTTSLYLDPVGGEDTNDGTTSGTAIQTLPELVRRLKTLNANTEYLVYCLNDIPYTHPLRLNSKLIGDNLLASNVINSGCTIRFIATPVLSRSGVFTAGVQGTDPTRVAASAQAEVTDTSVASWASDVGKLVINVNGQSAWVVTAKGGGNTARVSDWVSGTTFAYTSSAPVATDQYTVNTLVKWNAQIIMEQFWDAWWAGPGLQVIFENFHFQNCGKSRQWAGITSVQFRRCKFSNELDSPVTSNFTPPSGTSVGYLYAGRFSYAGCLFANYGTTLASCTLSSAPGIYTNVGSGCAFHKMRVIQGPGYLGISGMLIQGGWFQSGSSSGEINAANCVWGSTAAGFWVGIYSDYELPAGSGITAHILLGRHSNVTILGSVYGQGDGSNIVNGLSMARGRCFVYSGLFERGHGSASNITCWNLQKSSTGLEMVVDGLTTLVPTPDVNADTTHLLPARASYVTFTEYRNTFLRNAINMVNGAGIFSY